MDAPRTDPDPKSWPPVWKLWANPILRRYCRSRLRPRGLSVWLLVTLLITGFIFFVARESSIHRINMDPVDAERTPLIALLVVQGIILFLLATGQVAGAMTAEADEGVLDYQRLAPMSPLAKVLGYLFGLPIREYVMFAATLPFSIWSLWRGQVPPAIALQLYGIFLSSAVLYHLTGLVAGTVVKNRRWAFLVSMGLVFLLYTVIPQLAKFGFVYFKYLTMLPVGEECLPYLIPRDEGAAILAVQNLLPRARFFDLDFPQAVFTLVSQGALILTAVVVLWRRWRRAESHLLGKAWAAGLFAWLQLVLLGNALPLIEPGYLFFSRGLNRVARRLRLYADWEPDLMEAVAMVAAYGLVTLLMLWAITLLISPNGETRLRGWRRARKRGSRHLSPCSDPATAFPWILLMVGLGAGGWFVFARAVIESRWFPGLEVPGWAFWTFLLVLANGGLGFHALLEGLGGRLAGLGVILVGLVPVMVGSIAGVISDRFAALATWLIGISPLSAPAYVNAAILPLTELPADLARAVPRAFWFWQAMELMVLCWLSARLWRSLRAVAQQADHPGA